MKRDVQSWRRLSGTGAACHRSQIAITTTLNTPRNVDSVSTSQPSTNATLANTSLIPNEVAAMTPGARSDSLDAAGGFAGFTGCA